MPVDADRMQKPVRKVRKLLKNMSTSPGQDEVHDLRTNSRRIEAALHALSLDSGRPERQALKQISKLRKRAGKVRDMDVLTSYASQMPRLDGEQKMLRGVARVSRRPTPEIRQEARSCHQAACVAPKKAAETDLPTDGQGSPSQWKPGRKRKHGEYRGGRVSFAPAV
jgi:CHAD domain-containing protein